MYFCQNQICYCTNIYKLHCTIVLLVWATCIWHVCKLYLISQPSAAPYLINPTGQRHWISWQRSWEGLFWWNSQEVQWWRSFAGSKPCVNDCEFHGQDLMVDICYIYLGTVFRDSKHITIYIYIYFCIWVSIWKMFGEIPSGWLMGLYIQYSCSFASAQVYKCSWWMAHYGAKCPKRTKAFSNSKYIHRLCRGKLTAAQRAKCTLKTTVKTKSGG